MRFVLTNDGFLFNLENVSCVQPLEGGTNPYSIVHCAGGDRFTSMLSVQEWALLADAWKTDGSRAGSGRRE